MTENPSNFIEDELLFPVPPSIKVGVKSGMSLRDWFAGQALAGMTHSLNMNYRADEFARGAYRLADAMLAERVKGEKYPTRTQFINALNNAPDVYRELMSEIEALTARAEKAERERDEALEKEHYATGTCELAMKHRDEAEAREAKLREALELAEELYQMGVLEAPKGLYDRVQEARRAALKGGA